MARIGSDLARFGDRLPGMRSATSADLQLDLVRRADVEQATICKSGRSGSTFVRERMINPETHG
jgi:hypothetical protein